MGQRKIPHLSQSLYDGILLEIVSFLRRNLDRVSAQHVFDASKMNRHLSQGGSHLEVSFQVADANAHFGFSHNLALGTYPRLQSNQFANPMRKKSD